MLSFSNRDNTSQRELGDQGGEVYPFESGFSLAHVVPSPWFLQVREPTYRVNRIGCGFVGV